MSLSQSVDAAGAPDLLSRLRGRGWRLSPQRRVIAEVLAGEHVHLSAEDVHERAGHRLPELSRATVYNTLNELVAMGEVIEVAVTGGAKRYDPNAHRAHHHVVCRQCQAIRDVDVTVDPEVPPPDAVAGYVVTETEVVYRGLCPACAAAHPSGDHQG